MPGTSSDASAGSKMYVSGWVRLVVLGFGALVAIPFLRIVTALAVAFLPFPNGLVNTLWWLLQAGVVGAALWQLRRLKLDWREWVVLGLAILFAFTIGPME